MKLYYKFESIKDRFKTATFLKNNFNIPSAQALKLVNQKGIFHTKYFEFNIYCKNSYIHDAEQEFSGASNLFTYSVFAEKTDDDIKLEQEIYEGMEKEKKALEWKSKLSPQELEYLDILIMRNRPMA